MRLLESIRTAFSLPDLRRRILFTIGIMVIYRLTANIPVPGVDLEAWFVFTNSGAQSGLLGVLDLLSGGAVSNFSVMAMGVYPYITASIIIQLITPIVPYLRELQEEGEQGRNRITKITYYLTIPLAVAQAVGQIRLIGFTFAGTAGGDALAFIMPQFGFSSAANILPTLTTLMAMVGGTMFAIWLGEKITENGIGQGISLIIFSGIASQIPQNLLGLIATTETDNTARIFSLSAFVIITLVTTFVIVMVQEGERRIPVQYSRQMRGRKMYQGQRSHIPLKVNTAGMIPIIFAQALLTFPPLLASFFLPAGLPSEVEGFGVRFARSVSDGFNAGSDPSLNPYAFGLYWIMTFLFVAGFTFFYTDVMIKQQRLAQNLQQRGGFVPGIRPGKKTSDYITAVVRRITLVGAIFLGTISILPGIMQLLGTLLRIPGLGQSAFVINGAGLIIVVGVVLDTMRQIEAQLIMRNYESAITG